MSESTNTVLEVQDGDIDLTEVFNKLDNSIKQGEDKEDGKAS